MATVVMVLKTTAAPGPFVRSPLTGAQAEPPLRLLYTRWLPESSVFGFRGLRAIGVFQLKRSVDTQPAVPAYDPPLLSVRRNPDLSQQFCHSARMSFVLVGFTSTCMPSPPSV